MGNGISYSALSYALAALGGSSSGGGGGTGGTISVQVDSTITGAPGSQASVVNLGTDQNVILQFTIPQGLQGLAGIDGSQWFISNDSPGQPITNSKDGDLILYSTGEIYQIVSGVPNDTGINIIGKEGFSPTIEVKTNTSTEYILTIENETGSFDTPNLYPNLETMSGLVLDGGDISNM